MAVERSRRVEELFEEALTRPVEERTSFLSEACGEDRSLRDDVESLLAHREALPADFMRPPTPGSGMSILRGLDAPDPRVGKEVGGYRIKSIIASGGMGTVYLAEQADPKRDVALKVMRGGVASRSTLRRFRFESQILAHLRHPNIAQVFEAGIADLASDEDRNGPGHSYALPYFAMEYIPGAKSITKYAEGLELSTRKRLELFTQVCEAVCHGHQKGIIHRDLKPANILVDSSGSVKVIDFGVARSTNSDIAITTLHTDVGQIVGTLQYMSPEQCEADPEKLDTRSDVYALGVVLYELLCRQLPYEVAHTPIPQAARVVCEQPPIRPSEVDRKLRGDLELIVLKALEKDPERRYQSTTELLQDIRRYLAGEPIEARPPTAWSRAVRWAVRHPIVVTATACLSIATIVVALTFTSVWFLTSTPQRMRRADDWREAWLLSVSGKILHTWQSPRPRGITVAEMVPLRPKLAGQRLAILGFGLDAHDELSGRLCLFDVGEDLENPRWAKGIREGDLPESLRARGRHARLFSVGWAAVHDIFPESPGPEIVAIYKCMHSQRALRVYSLAGEVLYQVWHEGDLKSCYWMSDARLLVFVGDNGANYWLERGHPEVQTTYPQIVFAIRPRLRFVSNEYIDHGLEQDDPLMPAWYSCVCPPSVTDIIQPFLVKAPYNGNMNKSVELLFRSVVDPDACAGWVIDEFGNKSPEPSFVGDPYQQNQFLPDDDPRKLPDPYDTKLWHFGPLPPIVSTTRSADESPPVAGS